MRKIGLLYISFFFLLFCSSITWGQISAWQFGSPASLGSEVTYNATTTDPNLNISVLSRGAGMTATGGVRQFASNTYPLTPNNTQTYAIANNVYYAFTISAKSSFKVSLSTLDIKIKRTSTGPNAYIWRYSLDNTTFNDIGSAVSDILTGSSGDVQTTITLSGISALQNVANPGIIYFRLYAWGSTGATGAFSIGQDVTSSTINVLAIGGTVASSGAVTAPTIQAHDLTFPTVTSNGMTVNWTNGDGAKRVVIMNTSSSFTTPTDGGTDPTANTVYGGSGQQVIYNNNGSSVTITGLTASQSYSFKVFEYNGSGATSKFLSVDATNNPKSQSTSSGASAPIVTLTPALAIDNSSATWGASVSDGGSSITFEGTIWKANTPGATISDNPVAHGDNTTPFTDLRTLPAQTLIYYNAYATNNVNTSLGTELSLRTLSNPPTVQAGTVTTANPTTTSLDLVIGTAATFPGSGAGKLGYVVVYATGTPTFTATNGHVPAAGVGTVFTPTTTTPPTQPATTFTVTGLSASTAYNFIVVPYTWDGSNPETYNYLKTTIPTASGTTSTPPATTYTWNGGVTGDWTVATNWSPTRTTPATNDVLVFNVGGTVTATSVPAQTIGQLSVSGNTTLNLEAGGAFTLTIGGGPGTDLSVASGSALNIDGANALTIRIATGATGIISGSMTFSNAAHKFTAADVSGLTFQSGSSLTQDVGCTGNIFGSSGTANGIVFANGSTFIQKVGSNPFALTQPASLVVFQTGSTFSLQMNSSPSLSGRTYANLEINNAAFSQLTMSGAAAFSVDNLTFINCIAATFTLTNVTIKGYLSVQSGAVSFAPSGAGTLTFGGSSLQPIYVSSPATLSFGSSSLTSSISNSAGVLLAAGTLTLGGKLSLGSNNLTLLNGTTLSATSTNYIVTDGSGTLTQHVGSSDVLYPIGVSTSSYTPVTLNNTGGTSDDYSINVVTASGSPATGPNIVDKRWTITEAISGGSNLLLTFQWNASNELNGPLNHNAFKIGVDNGANLFENMIAHPVQGGNPYTIKNFIPFTLVMTGGKTFTVGESSSLPVELSTFTPNVNGRVINLNWETKTEKNSNKFDIERSAIIENADLSWTAIGSVKAANLSNSPKQYSFTDKNLQAGKYQYRLKMIDNDGTFQYSQLVETEVTLPKDFDLSQNYPNPFNPSTKINYSLPNESRVTLEIYNVLGVKVGQLVNQDQSAGYYSFNFSSSSLNKNITSGVYLYRLTAVDKVTGNSFSAIKKMMMLK